MPPLAMLPALVPGSGAAILANPPLMNQDLPRSTKALSDLRYQFEDRP